MTTIQRNFVRLYVHCVWATWDRSPLVTSALQEAIYASIAQQCKKLNCTLIALGGIADHVHLLANLPPTLTISELIGKVKGSSSHHITHEIQPGQFFKWQGGYGAFTVGYQDLDRVADYIRNQPIHYQKKAIVPAWEPPTTHCKNFPPQS